MADINSGLGWSAAQWEKVSNAVTEAFGKASVAGAFLPCYGPLSESAEYVRDEKFTETGAKVKVEDDITLKLFNLTVKVELSSEQVGDDALSSALLAFRRAANTLAQFEDHFVFNGFKPGQTAADLLRAEQDRATAKTSLETAKNDRKHAPQDRKQETEQNVSKAEESLRDTQTTFEEAERTNAKTTSPIVVAHPDSLDGLAEVDLFQKTRVAALKAQNKEVGELLVSAVVNTIARLEDDSHPGPFACVLGSNVFEEAQRPVKASMVLPADRITPLLNGPLLRSGQMDKDTGIVVSLAGSDIDIVVATPPKVQFLQVNEDAKYLFRVYEKFVLRIKVNKTNKDDKAVRRLVLA